MVAQLNVGIRNDINKVGHFKVHIPELTAANIAASITAAASLQSAVVGLSLGTFASRDIVTDVTKSAILPTGEVQLGDKWIVTAQDSAGNLYTYTIPAEDSGAGGANLITGTHNADLTSTAWAAFVTAFNAIAVSRTGGALSVVSARLGTRLGT